MRKILTIAAKDMMQILRDWKSSLFLLLMPLVFTLFFGMIFNGSGEEDSGGKQIVLGIRNLDEGGFAGALLTDRLRESGKFDVLWVESSESGGGNTGAQAKRSLVLKIPSGFTESLFSGERKSTMLYSDRPEGAPERWEAAALETELKKVFTAAEAAAAGTGILLERLKLSAGSPAASQYRERAFKTAYTSLQKGAFTIRTAAIAASGEKNTEPGGFEQSSPGMIVQFTIFGLITSAMLLLLERKSGALGRLLSSPVSAGKIICGHLAAMFLVVFVQQLILVLLGQFVFGVQYFADFSAVLVLMISLALWTSSLGLFIGSIARQEEQVVTLSLICMFVFAAFGGAWFPLEITGKTFAAVGHIFPTAWAMDGFQNIILRGYGIRSVLLPAGILLGYASVFLGLGVWQFRLRN